MDCYRWFAVSGSTHFGRSANVRQGPLKFTSDGPARGSWVRFWAAATERRLAPQQASASRRRSPSVRTAEPGSSRARLSSEAATGVRSIHHGSAGCRRRSLPGIGRVAAQNGCTRHFRRRSRGDRRRAARPAGGQDVRSRQRGTIEAQIRAHQNQPAPGRAPASSRRPGRRRAERQSQTAMPPLLLEPART